MKCFDDDITDISQCKSACVLPITPQHVFIKTNIYIASLVRHHLNINSLIFGCLRKWVKSIRKRKLLYDKRRIRRNKGSFVVHKKWYHTVQIPIIAVLSNLVYFFRSMWHHNLSIICHLLSDWRCSNMYMSQRILFQQRNLYSYC